ncbi:MAG: ABC transporter substrate-binding protein [Myxococcales bacterium]
MSSQLRSGALRAAYAVGLACTVSSFGCEFIVGRDALGKPIPVAEPPDDTLDDHVDSGMGHDAAPEAPADAGSDASDSDAGEVACSHTQDCVDRLGENFLCHHERAVCVSLLADHCTEVIGDYKNDSALLLGSIGPTTGPNSSTGLSNLWGIKLAVDDFTVSGNGLPPVENTGRRPIVVVHCDDAGNTAQAIAGAQHLVSDLGVSAIIGPSFSGITLSVASQIAIPAGVLLISPSATSAALTDLMDNNLLWRTSPSDVIQARAQTLLATRVRGIIQTHQGIIGGSSKTMRLALLHKGDPYGIGLAEDVSRSLLWNDGFVSDPNAPYVTRFNYGDPGNPVAAPIQYDEAVAKVLTLKPHLVLLYGTAEVATLVEMIEAAWDDDLDGARPSYVFADGAHTAELSAVIEKVDPDGALQLADRVSGTEPGAMGGNYELFQQLYVSKAEAPPVPITFGSANAYDALYVLAYASVVAGKAHPVGVDLAAAIGKLVPADGVPRVDVGGTRINGALKELLSGGRIESDRRIGTPRLRHQDR